MHHTIYILRSYLQRSQHQLARESGITQPDLSEMETLAPYGRMDKYQRLSRRLAVPVDVLLKDDPSRVPMSFFDAHPAPEYLPLPKDPDHLLGRQGEEFIFRREQERLEATNPVLARLVLPFFKMDCKSPGFDILSYDENGIPVPIEVKTTAFVQDMFRLTSNELRAARDVSKAGGSYHICHITGWGTPRQHVEDLTYDHLTETYQISPMYFRCVRKPEPKLTPITGIVYWRQKFGVRQDELARAVGMRPCHLSLYETGARGPTVDFYLKASEYLGVSVDELLAKYDPAQLEVD